MNALGEPRSVLLLGGTSDIGLATVRAVRSPNLRRVVLAGRDADRLQEVADGLRTPDVEVSTAIFDAADTTAHGPFVDETFERRGDLDVVVLAFGVLGDQVRIEAEPDAASEVVEVNYHGVVSIGLHLARRMTAQGHGWIVLLSSVAAERARRDNYVYGSSKAGADAFAQGLGDALTGTGVRVMVVRPGFVRTKMTEERSPRPFAVGPDAVGQAVARALEREREMVWVPSHLRWIMAAIRHLPRPLFRRITA